MPKQIPWHNQACGNCFHPAECHGRPAEDANAQIFCSECRRDGKECHEFIFKQEYYDDIANVNPWIMSKRIQDLEKRVAILEAANVRP